MGLKVNKPLKLLLAGHTLALLLDVSSATHLAEFLDEQFDGLAGGAIVLDGLGSGVGLFLGLGQEIVHVVIGVGYLDPEVDQPALCSQQPLVRETLGTEVVVGVDPPQIQLAQVQHLGEADF